VCSQNIPTETITEITYEIIGKQERPAEIVPEIIKLIELVLDQNYLIHNDQCYKQKQDLAVGPRTTAIFVKSCTYNM
jgi:hypothetical protein